MKSQKLAKYLEVFGLICILTSSFIQLFLLNILEEISQETIQYKIENKLDIIYAINISNYKKLHPDNKNVKTYHFPNDFERSYIYAENNKNSTRVSKQTNWTKKVIGFIFILGSILIIIGKLIEIKTITKPRSQYIT